MSQQKGILSLIFSVCMILPSMLQAKDWIYTVKTGDNLWNLTADFLLDKSYVNRIQKYNQVADPDYIVPGSKLTIPSAWLKKHPMLVRVLSLQGNAELIDEDSGTSSNLVPGSIIIVGDTIRTADSTTLVLTFLDGSKLSITENSLLKIKRLGLYDYTGMSVTRLKLLKGRVETLVTPQKGSAREFEISTPITVTSVRGTDYRISADVENQESRTEVLDGGVNVAGNNITRLVAEGYGMLSSKHAPPKPPVRLLDPPAKTNIPHLFEQVPIQFQLPKLPEKQMYRVQIAKSTLFDNVLFNERFSKSLIRGPDLPDGKYQMRIRSIDAQGIEGKNAQLEFTLNARPEAPFPIAPQPGAGTVLEDVPQFEWSHSTEINKYHFQIADHTNFQNILIDVPDTSDTKIAIGKNLQKGKYYWRVASVDDVEGTGPFSDPQLFRRILPGPEMEQPEIGEEYLVVRSRAGLPGQKYQFQMAEDEQFSVLLIDEQTQEPKLQIPKPDAGEYYIRVRTIDPDGFNGPFGKPQIIDIPLEGLYWFLLLLPLLALIAL